MRPAIVLFTLLHYSLASYDLRQDVNGRSNRAKRYILSKNKWSFDVLTWQLNTDNIKEADIFIIRTTLHRAFTAWSAVSALRFLEIPPEVTVDTDLKIGFVRGKHDDNLPFDGPEGIVAHAFYPTIGVLHFDSDENWTLNQFEGINLYQTAVHEIGHLIGLEHSTDSRSVMFPKNKVFDSAFDLGDDDVRAVRRLYPPLQKSRDHVLRQNEPFPFWHLNRIDLKKH